MRPSWLVRSEFLPGLTTFLSMVYLLVVIPHILHYAGMPLAATLLSVVLIAGFSSIAAGLIANTPIVFAPGLGLLSFFAYVVVGDHAIPWQRALASVFVADLLLVLVSFTPIRRWILQAIPKSLGIAITGGIGFFLGMLALHTAHVITASSKTLVMLGQLHTFSVLLFVIGFFIVVILDARKIPGALLIGLLSVSVLDWIFGGGQAHFYGVFALPSWHLSLWDQLDFQGLLSFPMIMTTFTFFLIGLFDSTGCILGLLKMIPQCEGMQKKTSRALCVESVSSAMGALMGLTTSSPLLESSAGIGAGGRSGKTAIWVGGLLLFALFLGPLTRSIPMTAVSAILFYVGCLMLKPIADLEWGVFTEVLPAVVTLLTIPLTFSISDGVGMGVITYVILNLSYGQFKKIKPGLYGIALFFIFYFIFS